MLRSFPTTVRRMYRAQTAWGCCRIPPFRYATNDSGEGAHLAVQQQQRQELQRKQHQEELRRLRKTLPMPPIRELYAPPAGLGRRWRQRAKELLPAQSESPMSLLDGSFALAPTYFGEKMVAFRMKYFFGPSRHYLYKACTEQLDYMQFMRLCEMEDTFDSWFTIVHLHIWMLLVRLRLVGKYGKQLSWWLVDLMWQDMHLRARLLGLRGSRNKKQTFRIYQTHFHGLNFLYDEAILQDDTALASALWSSFFYTSKDTDEEYEGIVMKSENDNVIANVARMVEYVRKNTQYLESIDSYHLCTCGMIKWMSLHDGVPIQYPDAVFGGAIAIEAPLES